MVLVATVAALVLLLGAWWRWRRDWRIPASEYAAYISSAAWSRRKRRWKRQHFLPWSRLCRVCWSPNVQAHHKTYRRLGHELGRDLVPLCERHHREVTAMHHQPGVSVEAATKRYLSRPRVRLLTAAPALPVVLAAAVVLPHLR